MNWPTAAQLTALCPPADGHAYEVLGRAGIPELAAALRTWQPAWQVGAASVFGFVPGCDREDVAPGAVKRVIEAACCQVLAPRDALLSPCLDDMTPRVRALYERLYPTGWPAPAA